MGARGPETRALPGYFLETFQNTVTGANQIAFDVVAARQRCVPLPRLMWVG